ncbi:MAG: hypothetical protein E6I76_17290 [Chloroflexi bacterium]|nr:MAG: hypothetical protein E6I76_17290 [Chloroflexota bacterium]
MNAQMTRPADPADSVRRVPLRGRVIVESRLPADDDSAPYPAAGGFFWDQVLREKRGPLSRD